MAIVEVMWKVVGWRGESVGLVQVKGSGLLATGAISITNSLCGCCEPLLCTVTDQASFSPPLGSIGNLGDDGFFLSRYRRICPRRRLSACRLVTWASLSVHPDVRMEFTSVSAL